MLEERTSSVFAHMEKHKRQLVARNEVSWNGNFSFQKRIRTHTLVFICLCTFISLGVNCGS